MSNSDEPGRTGVAIVGLAGRFPGATNITDFWQNLKNGVESVSFFADEELDPFAADPASVNRPHFVKAGCVIDGVELFDAAFFDYSPREAEITDPQHRLFLECAWEALENAGYDPDKYAGSIGVFAGASMSTYLLFNFALNPRLFKTFGAFQITVGNDKDYLATRVSYKLNLRGPSINVQTACSTSLVAVSLACQSLLDYQCDIALAGGVSVRVPQKSGYVYEEGGILSPDGHCRAFDASGQGTLFGNGLGIAVLKRLDEALADGDNIIAVIRGTAINNDGIMKIGYTAPSIDGQAAVVAEALAAAGVDAGTISYIEAHGTATPLGDPIEIAALNKAFSNTTHKKQFCALGSVKTNVGHLDSAAGIAGLIKTALALKEKLIPPSLLFEKPNPQINFEDSPFYVNTAIAEWPGGPTPRRAGVSSFGIGGTNAHVILEEAPVIEPSSASRPCHLLLLSTKTAAALETATRNLAAHLQSHPEIDLADVAFTLQLGRKDFKYRRMLVCREVSDAVSALEPLDASRVLTWHRETAGLSVVFMCSGQGSQYINMGLELYQREPTFRLHVDQCAELLKPHLGLDLRGVLYPDEKEAERASEQIQQTQITQAALFVVEFALAKLWMQWGVLPQAIIGHSIGEYVAACLAGVFSLADALAVVAARGRAMQQLPRGSMLAVSLSEEEAQAVPMQRLSVAAINGPSLCVVSGPTDAITELQNQLNERGVNCRLLQTSHAFHSEMMEPVIRPFIERLKGINLRPPKIPFVSSVTGTWITEAEATDPVYWGRQLRRTVRFTDGLKEVLKGTDRVLLEIGPGTTLTTLARQHPSKTADQVIIPTLRHPHDRQSDEEFLLDALGRLWLVGAKVDWPGFYAEQRRTRLMLPTYPFERQRYWIEPPPQAQIARSSALADALVDPQQTQALEDSTRSDTLEATDESVGGDLPRGMHSRPPLANAYVPPANETQQKLASVWQDFLGIEKIGIHDNFFELGGHSLLATQLVTKLSRSFKIAIPLRSLFDQATIAELAAAIENRQADQAETEGEEFLLPTIVPDPERLHDPFPLTDVQQAYLIGRSGAFELGNVATHIYFEFESADLDLPRFEQAWRRMIDRHGMLRAIVLPDGRQQILDQVPAYRMARLDLSEATPEEVTAGLHAVRQQMSHQVLPSDQWPLFEIRATLLPAARVRLHISFDLLIGDARSLEILARELTWYYANPQGSLEPLELSFRDYVLAEVALEDSPLYEHSRQYWWGRLPTLPPAPELPLAKSPGSLTKPRFVRRSARLDQGRWAQLKNRSAEAGLTPSGVLLAAFAEVLTTWSKRPQFSINLTIFNRHPLHPQVNDIVGDFTSLILLAIDNSRAEAFEQRARRIQTQLWEDLDHRYVSAIRVMRELTRQQGWEAGAAMPVVFTSILNMEGAGQRGRPGETAGQASGDALYSISQTPQVWIDHQVAESGGALFYNWDVVEELFPDGLIADMFAAYCRLLERLADDGQVWSRSSPGLVTDAHLELQAATNATDQPLPQGLLQNLFAAQVTLRPGHLAVVAANQKLTYEELERRSNQLARRLRASGARPNQLIAVVMDKGWEQVVAVLAILKSGAAYLPIDAEVPLERLSYLLAHGEVEIVLTQPWLDDRRPWPEGIRRLRVDDAGMAGTDDSQLNVVQRPDDLAYVIYTSGSTGQPKGVMIDHRGAVNTVLDMNERFAVAEEDRVLALSSLSFDLSVYDIFGVLAAGGTIVMPTPEAKRDPMKWAEWLDSERVTIWNTVPALMEMLVDYAETAGRRLPQGLRLVLLSGDWIPLRLPDRIKSLAKGAGVISLGGATEASIWSILYPIDVVKAEWKSIPYGRPMVNQQFYVLNERMEPCPVWVIGQLYIGGAGLARGYWRDEEKTRKSFINHPDTGERLYRTGDMGRYLPDGNIEFLGREDFQVKVHGYRIELGEIEAALAEHESVKAVVVSAVGERQANKRLVAYVIGEQDHDLSAVSLDRFLKGKLPEYMVPSTFVFVDALPLNANGKIDRRSLPTPNEVQAGDDDFFMLPRTPEEESLAQMWAQILDQKEVGIYDNFFELGGDSVLATRLFYQLREAFNVELPLGVLFTSPTVAGLAQAIDYLKREGTSAAMAAMTAATDLNAEAVLDPEIRSDAEAITTPVAEPERIFLTGATGFLGAFLLHELLQQTQADIFCLVRSSSLEEGKRRIRENLELYALSDAQLESRIVAVPGDLSQRLFGLSEADFHTLASTTDAIYHNGGAVDYVSPYYRLKPINVLGTQEVLRLASRVKVKPVHFTSTLGIVPRTSSPDQAITREPYVVESAEHLKGGYLQSKWVAEKLIAQAWSRGIPVSIYRPGYITGSSRTGVWNTDDFICRMIKGCIQLGAAPDTEAMVDMIPVDYVATAIVHLSKQKELPGRAFHLTNPRPISFRDFVERARSYGYSIRLTSYAEWRAELMSVAKHSPDHALYPLLSFFPPLPADGEQLAEQAHSQTMTREGLKQRGDIRNALEGLAGTSMTSPAVDETLLSTYFAYLISSGFLDAPEPMRKLEGCSR
jgi:amino acid adenylation domain-containing protein/thioester reductase-like protein